MKAQPKRAGMTSVQIRPQIIKNMAPLLKQGMTKSEIINEALRKYLAEKNFQAVREALIPYAQAKGLYTDEDVMRFLEE